MRDAKLSACRIGSSLSHAFLKVLKRAAEDVDKVQRTRAQ